MRIIDQDATSMNDECFFSSQENCDVHFDESFKFQCTKKICPRWSQKNAWECHSATSIVRRNSLWSLYIKIEKQKLMRSKAIAKNSK